MSDDDQSSDDASEAAGTVAQTAQNVGALTGAVSEAERGDVAGGIASGLPVVGGAAGMAAGTREGEAGEALRATSATASAASSVLGAVGGLAAAGQSGDVGRAAGALGRAGSDGSRYVVPDSQAQQVLRDGGELAGQAQSITGNSGGLGSIGGGSGGERGDVEFHLEVSAAAESWAVTQVNLSEALNKVPSCTIQALYAGHLVARDVLYSECVLSIERPSNARSFKGIVWSARIEDDVEGLAVTLHVVPAAALLTHRFESRIFQDKTVVAVIKDVYQRVVGDLHRSVDDANLSRTYETREYVVQYQESCLAFISRLAEEEGIFFYFDHEQDGKEVLVLADAVENLPQARAHADGEVDYHDHPEQTPEGESAWNLRSFERIGPTDVVLGDYDWSNPPLEVRAEQTGRSQHQPALEIYDHVDALVMHDFAGQYRGNTAAVQARLRAQRLDLDRQRWEMTASVVTAKPGLTLAVTGCPDDGLDQRYLIVAARSHGAATPGVRGTWANTLELVPVSMPYRPPRITPRPVLPSIETAVVVGPSGSEIHTDSHGRVRVHFHWDREHARDAEDSSCWLRVAHNWAGAGFGNFFLPRVGMEVVVSFAGGNPDRPLVTACVYNGVNRPNVELDAKKTQSLIRTKSSPNSDGFNEIRFEDEAGKEFIYIHAEKDFNEEVEHNHSTHVMNNQSNTVDANQTETVGGNQAMTVKKDRTKTIEKNEIVEVQEDRTEDVGGKETVTIVGERHITVKSDEKLDTDGNRTMSVKKKLTETVSEDRKAVISASDKLEVGGDKESTIAGKFETTSDGKFQILQGGSEKILLDSKKTYVESGKEIELKTGSSDYSLKNDGNVKLTAASKVEIEVGGCKLEMTTSKITLTAGASSIELTSSGVTTSGAKVTSSAQTVNEITGLLVKIN